MNSQQVAYQEDDNLKLQKKTTSEIVDQTFKQELDRMAKDAYSETLRYIANLQSIFDISEDKLQISQDHDMLDGSDWEYRTAHTFFMSQMNNLKAFM